MTSVREKPDIDIEKLREGDHAAWNAVCPRLYAHATKAVICFRGSSVGDDLDLFAARAIEEVLEERCSLRNEAHLFAKVSLIAYRAASQENRKRTADMRGGGGNISLDARVLVGTEPKDPQPPPDDSCVTAEVVLLVSEANKMGAPRDWELLCDRYLLDVKYKDIATKYGWEIETVGRQLQHAKRRIREFLMNEPKLAEIIAILDLEGDEQ